MRLPCSTLLFATVGLCLQAFASTGGLEEKTPLDSWLKADKKPPCCSRHKKMKTLGVSVVTAELTGALIEVDVGACRKHCSVSRKIKRHEFELLMKENPDMNPKELFLQQQALRRHDHQPSCPEDETCVPSSSHLEYHSTTEGTASVSVIDGCSCRPVPTSCRKVTQHVTLHKGSPFETTLDKGDCLGECYHGLGCRATQERTVAVEGPNGMECVSVTEQCGCVASCYRASHFQHFYDHSGADPEVKVVDVGACVGECDEVEDRTCVYRETTGDCTLSLKRRSPRCGPVSLRHTTIMNEEGEEFEIPTVRECGCH